MGGHVLAGDSREVADHGVGKPVRRPDDRAVVGGSRLHQFGDEYRKAVPTGRSAVGVDGQGRIGARLVADGRPDVRARAVGGAAVPGEDDLCAGCVRRPAGSGGP